MKTSSPEGRAARTLSRHLAPAHHYLSRRLPAYQRWDSRPYAHGVHWFLLLLVLIGQIFFVRQAVFGAGFGGGGLGGQPPALATVTNVTPGQAYFALTLPFTGQAADNSGGQGLVANSTTYTLEREIDHLYWTGLDWDLATDLATSHEATISSQVASWSSITNLPVWTDGIYLVTPKARNQSGQVLVGSAVSFIYDATSPSAPQAVADGIDSNDDAYARSTSQLSATWTAASDLTSGLSHYQWAVGTVSGASDVVAWTDNSLGLSATISDLSLTEGASYYLSVRAVDQAGNSGPLTSSNGVVVDSQPPTAVGDVADGPDLIDDLYSTSVSELMATWSTSLDGGSGLAGYDYAIGTTRGGQEVREWTQVDQTTTLRAEDLLLADGQRYFVAIRSRDWAGNIGPVTSSDGVLIDRTPPLAERPTVVSPTHSQIPTITWPTVNDPSGIALVKLMIGTTMGGNEETIVNLPGTATTYTPASPLLAGTYFIHLQMTDGAGNQGPVSANQILVIEPFIASQPVEDEPPPVVPTTLIPESSEKIAIETGPASPASKPIATETPAPLAFVSPALPVPTPHLSSPPTLAPAPLTYVAGARTLSDQLAFLHLIARLPAVTDFSNVINSLTAFILLLGLAVTPLFNLSLLFPLDRLRALLMPWLFRRRKRWGQVVDAESGHPVSLAQVAVFRNSIPTAVENQVTDYDGWFTHPRQVGTYRLEVTKTGYVFPSHLSFVDYHGEMVSAGKKTQMLIIPIDPDQTRLRSRLVVLLMVRDLVVALRRPLLLVGSLLALLAFFDRPTVVIGLIVASYGLVWAEFVLEQRLYRLIRGRVFAIRTKQPLPLTILRFTNQINENLVRTVITNHDGEFMALVPPGYYQVRVTQPGFVQASYDDVVVLDQHEKIHNYGLESMEASASLGQNKKRRTERS